MDIKLHYFQGKAFTSTRRFVAAISGIQGGKTTLGAVWAINKYSQMPEGDGLICAPTYKILQQSTLKKLFSIYPSLSKHYNKNEEVIRPGGKGEIFVRSLEDPDSIEGITASWVWCDEAGQCKHRAWINIQGRVSKTQGQVLLTTTPYYMNWLYEEFYKRFLDGDDDYLVVNWQSVESPFFPRVEWERAKATLDEREFERRYGGKFVKFSNTIYPNFNPTRHAITDVPRFQWKDTVLGYDSGFNNPAAFVVVRVTKDDDFYVVQEWYKSGTTLDERVKVAGELNLKYHPRLLKCDPAEPGDIEMFQRAGLPAIKAINDVDLGINKVRNFINSERLKVNIACYNLIDELNTYHYAESDNVEAKEKPDPESPDHAVDALRYALADYEVMVTRLEDPFKVDFWARVGDRMENHKQEETDKVWTDWWEA